MNEIQFLRMGKYRGNTLAYVVVGLAFIALQLMATF